MCGAIKWLKSDYSAGFDALSNIDLCAVPIFSPIPSFWKPVLLCRAHPAGFILRGEAKNREGLFNWVYCWALG